jgi:hypothetical protein
MDNLLSSLIALETEKRDKFQKINETKLKLSEKLNEIDLINKKKQEFVQNIIKLVFNYNL